jgi:outer membrane protein assembly factor BamA
MKHFPEQKIMLPALQILFFVLTLCVAAFPISSSAQPAEPDTLQKERGDWVGFPIIFYTPDTKWAVGASGSYYYRPSNSDTATRPSNIGATLIYTQRKQIIAAFGFDLYSRNNADNPSGGIFYLKFPDTFYGIGNSASADSAEDYTHRLISLGLSFRKQVQPNLYLGIQYELDDDKLIKVEEDGLLAKGTILGSKGGTASGAGISVNWDSRNNLFFPTTGGLYGFSATFFAGALGSDFDFTRYNLSLRKYIPVFSSHVLAFQAEMSFRTGDPPFLLLAHLGGEGILRGYAANRYLGKNLLAGQVEYRMPLWRRFGVAGFAGYGDVADKLSRFEISNFKYSFGWGIRYLFNRDEKINLRLDFGYGKNSSEFYVSLTEAF